MKFIFVFFFSDFLMNMRCLMNMNIYQKNILFDLTYLYIENSKNNLIIWVILYIVI